MNNGEIKKNLLLMSVVQYSGYLIPLVITPYLTRILGLESYGFLILIQSFMLLGSLFADYGFSWSMTKKISENRNNKIYISDIFIAGLCIQFSIGIFFFLSLYAYKEFFSSALTTIDIILGFPILIGQVLYTPWMYQGLEIFKYNAFFQLLGKITILPFIYFFVNERVDVGMALFSMGFPSIIFGLISIYFLYAKKYVLKRLCDPILIKQIIFEGFTIFISRVVISSYTNFIPIAIGWFAGPSALGLFSIADRVRLLLQSFMQPVSQVLFPRMSWLFSNDILTARFLLKKSLIWCFFLSTALSISAYFIGDKIIFLLAGEDFSDAYDVLKILLFIPPVISISGIIGLQYMLPKGLNKDFLLIVGFGALVFILSAKFFIENYYVLGASYLILFVEIIISLLMIFYLYRNKYFLDN